MPSLAILTAGVLPPQTAHSAMRMSGACEVHPPGGGLPAGRGGGHAIRSLRSRSRRSEESVEASPRPSARAGRQCSWKALDDGLGRGIEDAGLRAVVAPGGEQPLQLGNRRPRRAEPERRLVSRRLRLDPEAGAGLRQPRPVELLAGIDLAERGDVGMREHVLGGDAMPSHDVGCERDHRPHLRLGEIRIAARWPDILDLDADRAIVDVALAPPIGDAGVPGAHLFRHHAGDRAVVVDDVVAGDFRHRIGEPANGDVGQLGRRVVKDQHVGHATLGPRLAIGRGMVVGVDHAGTRLRPSRNAITSTPDRMSAPPAISRQLQLSPSRMTPETEAMTGASNRNGAS